MSEHHISLRLSGVIVTVCTTYSQHQHTAMNSCGMTSDSECVLYLLVLYMSGSMAYKVVTKVLLIFV